MSKRPNSHLVAKLNASDMSLDGMVTHIIRRDRTEQYLLAVGNSQLHVWDLKTGIEYPIDFKAKGYLSAAGRRDTNPFKMLTLGDSTYVLNTTMPVSMDYTKRKGVPDADQPPVVEHQYRITVVEASTRAQMVLNKYGTHAGSVYSSCITGGEIKGVITVGGHDCAFSDSYDRDIVPSLVTSLKGMGYKAESSAGNVLLTVPKDVAVELRDTSYFDVKSYYLHGVGQGAYVGTSTRRVTHNLTSCALYGDVVTTAVSVERGASYVWIHQADYAVNYAVVLNGIKAEIKTPEATADKAREGLNSEKLTKELIEAINQADGHNCTASYLNGVIYITENSNKPYTIEVNDGLYNKALKLCKEAVQTAADLPPYAMGDDVIAITGETSDTESKGYYVAFDIDKKVWYETAAYGTRNYFNNNSMPHKLSRWQDPKYVTESNPFGIYFKFESIEWPKRMVGDEGTVSVPSFVSDQNEDGSIAATRFITCMAFYRGRLWMLGGDYATSSVANDPHNFWPSTAIITADDDPIDSYTDLKDSAETIHNAIPTAQGLLVYTKRAQYSITSQGMMSPATFEFKEVSAYSSDADVVPQPIGDRVTFTTQRSDYAAIYDSYMSPNNTGRVATDISGHVPEYISGRVRHILTSSTVNTQFYIMRDLGDNPVDTVYVYDFMFSGNDRVQSAWSKWQFNGQVLDGVLTDDAVYFVMRRMPILNGVHQTPIYTIERIDLVMDVTKDKLKHPVFLDCLQTSLTEPTGLSDDEESRKFKGVWYRGYKYLQHYRFSPFFLRNDSKGTGQTGGRLQLRRITLNFDQTTSFKVAVDTLSRERREVFFQGRVLGDASNLIGVIPVIAGSRSFPLLGASESIKVNIENDSLFDARFQSAFWEGFYYNRARRF